MKLENINITNTIEKAKRLLAEEKKVSPAFKAVMEILLLIVKLYLSRLKRWCCEMATTKLNF